MFFAAFSPVILGKKYSKYLPGPLLAVLAGIICSVYFDFSRDHLYFLNSNSYQVSEKYLVNLPANFFNGVAFPNFSKLFSSDSLQYILMFAIIGSLESLLTVKAVDSLDPQRRKSDLNRDLFAVGIGNCVCGLLGGLPMISEVVRSYANMSYGAKTKFANFFHGAFLLLYVALLTKVIHLIPISALSGVLCVTGYRLAAPKHFVELKKIGIEQLVVFIVTIVATLKTDLLIGVTLGILTEFVLSMSLGAIPLAIFKSKFKITKNSNQVHLKCPKVCSFVNVMTFKKITSRTKEKSLLIDFSETYFVDHTFMKEIMDIKDDDTKKSITLIGLERLSIRGEDRASLRIDAELLS